MQRKCLTISEILKVLPLELEGKDFTLSVNSQLVTLHKDLAAGMVTQVGPGTRIGGRNGHSSRARDPTWGRGTGRKSVQRGREHWKSVQKVTYGTPPVWV